MTKEEKELFKNIQYGLLIVILSPVLIIFYGLFKLGEWYIKEDD